MLKLSPEIMKLLERPQWKRTPTNKKVEARAITRSGRQVIISLASGAFTINDYSPRGRHARDTAHSNARLTRAYRKELYALGAFTNAEYKALNKAVDELQERQALEEQLQELQALSKMYFGVKVPKTLRYRPK